MSQRNGTTSYAFGDAESGKLPPWPASVPVSLEKALESVRRHQLSSTGEAIKALLKGLKGLRARTPADPARAGTPALQHAT